MFNKYKANTITNIYLNKYAELKHMLEIKNNEISDKELQINSLLNIYIEPTNRCNFNCVFCARENMSRKCMKIDFDVFKNL